MKISNPNTAMNRQHVSRFVPRNSNTIVALLMATTAVQAVTMGYDASMMNGLNILPAYTSYFDLNTANIALMTASIWVGTMVANTFAGQMSDWLGRKQVMFWGAVTTTIGVVVQTAAQNIAMFISGRIIIGVGAGISGVAAPIYLAETAPTKWRATLLALYYDLWLVGSLIAAGVTYGTKDILNPWAWRIPSLIQCLPSILCIVVLPFIPESPRWLVYQDRKDFALEVLAIAHGFGDKEDVAVVAEFNEIVQTLEFEKSQGSVSPLETIRTPGNRYRLMLAVSVGVLCMTAGNNIGTYYLGTMLDQAGITDTNTQLQVNMILSAWSLVISLIGTALVDKLGRKTLAVISTALCAILMFLVGGLSALYGSGSNPSGSYATVAMMFLFMGAYSWAWTPLTVLYPVEVLNYSTRAVGMGIYNFFCNGVGLMITFAFPFAFAAIGWKTYMVNGAFDVLAVVFIVLTWVETKGKSLEEIDLLIEGEKHFIDAVDSDSVSGDVAVIELGLGRDGKKYDGVIKMSG